MDILALAVAILLATEAGLALIRPEIASSLRLVPLAMIRLTQIVLVLSVVFFKQRNLSAIGLGKSRIVPGVIKGLKWSLGFGGIVCFCSFFIYIFGINPFKLVKVSLPKDTTGLALYFIVGGGIAPVAEEIFFRGILYGYFRKLGITAAIFFSTAIFGLAHLPSFSPVQIVGGVVFALAYEKEKKLTTAITIHSLGNLALFIVAMI